jgi:hypothetical protein
MRMRRLAPILALVTAWGLAGASTRAAEPSFFDPFDASVFGYLSTVGNVTVAWSDVDVDGAPDSGSALLVNTRGDAASGPVNRVLDCFPVAAGTEYTAGASILIPSGQDRTGVAQVFVSWHASGACSVPSLLSQGRTFEVRDAGSWQRSEEALTAPAGAVGARVGMVLFKNEALGTLSAHFDDLLFAPEPAGAAPGAAAALALAALHARRRDRRTGRR